MIYNLKKRMLILENGVEIKLTKLEHKFLIAISNESTCLLKDITKYLDCTDECIRLLKCRLLKKVKLNIKYLYCKGYRLIDEVKYE